MNLKLITAPEAEPVLIADMKAHLRVIHDEENDYIESLITAARDWCESFTRRRFITQTWDLALDAFPTDGVGIEIPYPPVQSITHVKYIDGNGVEQTLAPSVYTFDDYSPTPRIHLAYGQAWPSTRCIPNAVKVRTVNGYGPAGSDCPGKAIAAIRMLGADLYENREDSISGTIITEVPNGVKNLLWPLRHLRMDSMNAVRTTAPSC